MFKALLKASCVRAAYTFCEVAASMLTIGQAFIDVNWLNVLSVSGTAAVLAFFKSVVVGLPEVPVFDDMDAFEIDMLADHYTDDRRGE